MSSWLEIEFILPWLFLAGVVGGLALLLLTFFLSAKRSKQGEAQSEWWKWARIVVALVAVHWIGRRIFDSSGNEIQPAVEYLQLLCVATVSGFVAWCLMARSGEEASRLMNWRRPSFWVASTLAVLVLGWLTVNRQEIIASGAGEQEMLAKLPTYMVEARGVVAWTDKGTRIPLYTWDNLPAEFQKRIAKSLEPTKEMSQGIISRQEPSFRSNCHGFAFTGGEYYVYADSVKLILQENGYVVVMEPQAGDIAIYKDSRGGIGHTAVVRGVLADGTILLESKWDSGGVYLHGPYDQPYGANFSYYRTDRDGHTIRIENETSSGKKGPAELADVRRTMAPNSVGVASIGL